MCLDPAKEQARDFSNEMEIAAPAAHRSNLSRAGSALALSAPYVTDR
jgi:hypothetical protein